MYQGMKLFPFLFFLILCIHPLRCNDEDKDLSLLHALSRLNKQELTQHFMATLQNERTLFVKKYLDTLANVTPYAKNFFDIQVPAAGRASSYKVNNATALHVATYYANTCAMDYFITNGVSLNAGTCIVIQGGKEDGVRIADATALHLAVREGNQEMADFLLSRGAELNAQVVLTLPKKTLLEILVNPLQRRVIAFSTQESLILHGVTPLHLAAYEGNQAMATFLMQKCNADKACIATGKMVIPVRLTPSDVAHMVGHGHLAKALKK